MSELKVKIDGNEYTAAAGSTILDIVKENGIYIPTLCYDSRLSPYGACRLCLVEVEGARGLLPSCTTEATDGMIIKTSTEELERMRKTLVELLISDHPKGCAGCSQSGNCELQKLADKYGIEESSYKGEEHQYSILRDNPFILRDYNKCVLCGRCIRICREVQGVGVYDFVNRGFKALPGTPYEKPMVETPCEFCGQCISTCPTGALTSRLAEEGQRSWKRDVLRAGCAYFNRDMEDMMDILGLDNWVVRTTCPYCGCGCQLDLHIVDDKVVEVTSPLMTGPGQGNLCIKGRFGYGFIHSDERLEKPLVKRNGVFEESSWEEAVDLIAEKFNGIKNNNGPDSLAVLASARITNEENYLMQKLTRAAIGTNNIDHCARLCHAPTVAGLAASFGSGAMTNSIEDIEKADAILVIGSNTTEAHPIIGLRIKKAVMEHDCKLIVAEPRHIRLCYFADQWVQHNLGTDVALINAFMNVIISEELYDKEFVKSRTENFEELKKTVSSYTPEKTEKITGVEADEIRKAARTFATAENASIIYAMGITQHISGTDNVKSLANLAMLTGNIGREGTGVNPLRGQNNVQGACDMGALPNVYTGYQPVNDPEARKKFEKAWKVDSLPDQNGLTVTEMTAGALTGEIKAMYIVGENPMLSDPDIKHVAEAFENLDFLVVQDIFMTETAEFADVVLPSSSFAEKEGTFTNTERNVQRVRRAVSPPGEALPDLEIIAMISRAMGLKSEYPDAAAVMDEIASLTPSYGGISYERLDSGEILCWPCPDAKHPGTPILHTEKFPRGKGLFSPAEFIEPAESVDSDYPFLLTTGRRLMQYHTGTMTRKIEGINEIDPRGKVFINGDDASKLDIKNGDTVKVATRRNEIDIIAEVTDNIPSGIIFIPFHYKESPANALTGANIDPVSKIPEFKVSAARISK